MTVINFVFKQDGPIDVQERYGEVLFYGMSCEAVIKKVQKIRTD